MRTRTWVMISLLLAATLTAGGRRAVAAERPARKPNLLILVADQLRYQSLGYAGDRRALTPRLDRLAAEGASLRNYVVSTPVCAASRATFMTGKYASSTGMVINELRLNPNQDCLGHVLTAGGYYTNYLGKWHLWANELGNHQKIGNAFTPPGPYRLGFDGFWAAYNFGHDNYRAWYFRDTPQPHRIEGYGPDHFTDLAIERIRAGAHAGRPFALMLSYGPPHDPWNVDNVPKAWYDKFRNVDFPLPETWQDRPDPHMDRETDPRRWQQYWKPRLPEFMRIYYAMTANLDWNVGRLLDCLHELGIEDDTIVVFTADHGEQFGAHGRVFKMTFYEESARVPLLVRWPGKIPAGRQSDACMASPDLMPTLLGLAGLPIPAQAEGMNLAAEALGKPGPQPEFAFLQGMGHTCSWSDGFEWRALRDKQFTYAVYRSDGQELLFDNRADPQQAKNLAADAQYQATLAELRGKLKTKMTALGDTFESCSWYRDHWTKDRVILRGAKGDFHRDPPHEAAPPVVGPPAVAPPAIAPPAAVKTADARDMPAYQYPPEAGNVANAAHWQWMRAFYDREVSRPASPDETVVQVERRAARVKPTPEKLAYLDLELITFPHFGMSTVSGQQQGTGKENPRSFNPTAFDAREWVKFHQAIGAKMIVFVAKHHDGYALWPTQLNDYCIRSSPWRDGRGDMLRELADACREGGLKLGLYISLWDQHDPRCDNPRVGPEKMKPAQRLAYQAYVEQTLRETLIPYGPISELWFDGAGTNGVEDWNRIYELVHRYQPRCLVAMCGFGIRWCGNESAIGDAVNWNVLPLLPELSQHRWVPFHYQELISKHLPTVTDDLASLKGNELFFIPQECDTRVLNGGWHWDGVGDPRSLQTLVHAYYASIGSGGTLIISPSPDPSGAFPAKQAERLGALRHWIDESFRDNLLGGATLTLDGGQPGYDPAQLLRAQRDRPCFAAAGNTSLSLVAEFPRPQTFNNLVVEEFLEPGQRISAFALDAWQDGRWTPVAEGRTVGRKRVLPLSDTTAEKVRFRITAARDLPALRFLGLYRALPYRESKQAFTAAEFQPALPERENLKPGLRWTFYEDANNGFLPYQEMFGDPNTAKVTAVATGLSASPMEAVGSVPRDRQRQQHFALKFSGYFRAPARAVYTFKASANSGCRLYLDGRPTIENDASGGMKGGAKTADVPLQAGLHQVTILYYFGAAGRPRFNLVVEWPGNAGGDGFGWSSQQRLLPLLWAAAR